MDIFPWNIAFPPLSIQEIVRPILFICFPFKITAQFKVYCRKMEVINEEYNNLNSRINKERNKLNFFQ
jgi:hypothetical protein